MRNCFMLLFLSFTVLISCNDDSKSYLVGEDFIELDSRVVQIDTLTLKTSTIQLDSVVTSGSSRLLIGALKDPVFGDLSSQSFLKLAPKDFFIDENAVYDSIALILHYDRYYYGDTMQVQTYRVHEITDDFEPKDKDETQLYNTSTLNHSDEVLGELLFKAYPYKKDSINITLKQSFGENLFNNFQNKTIENVDDLEKIFKGITVIADNNSNNVLGFKINGADISGGSVVRLYYTLDDGIGADNGKYVDFTILQLFNNITSDKTTTALNSITDGEYILPSDVSNNKMYIQAGTSLNMRIEIPYVRDLNILKSENGGTVINAVLKMYPDPKSHNDNTSSIESLAVFVIDNKNRLVKQLIGLDGNPVYATLSSYNSELDYDYYYSANITAFVDEIQTSTYLTNYALLFQLPNNNQSVDKLLIYDSLSGKETKMKIELTYLLY
ncbi:MAG: DUF4270 family protein [Lutibacter sp.]|nr:DUF4270 family protein [Lutibacter sp.]